VTAPPQSRRIARPLLKGIEVFQAVEEFIRYNYDVLNKDTYRPTCLRQAPARAVRLARVQHQVERAPGLDFFDSRGKRLYGFVPLAKPGRPERYLVCAGEQCVPPEKVTFISN